MNEHDRSEQWTFTEGLKVALLVLPVVYVLMSGPMIKPPPPIEFDDVVRSDDEFDGASQLWRRPWNHVFRPLYAVSEVPVVGVPLVWYWGLFRPTTNANQKFEAVRDALTSTTTRPSSRS